MLVTCSRNAKRLHRAAAAVSLFAMLASASPSLAATGTGLEGDILNQINSINSSVNQKKSKLQQLSAQEKKYQEALTQKRIETASLSDDIALFDNRIAQKELDIEIAEGEIDQLELEMSIIDGKIKEQEEQMTRQRAMLGVLARKLYRVQFRKSALDILLSGKTLSEFFDNMRQIADLEAGVTDALRSVQAIRVALDEQRGLHETKKLAVEEHHRGLEIAKRELEDQRMAKQNLLDVTKADELQYRYQLAELKREQSSADYEIASLEKKLREKMDLADRLKGLDSVLSWPLVPARGLSTRFHDPEYPFRYVYEHPGIDVPSPQGTPVRAAAAGIVGNAKDAGMGYSYVMLLHAGGMSTVYGHLSKIVAKQDSFVERGEIIGYSGGMPGTPGAGKMTTGPHLHLEARLNGIPVDPMKYLVSYK